MLQGRKVEQIAYVVNDVRQAAAEHSRLFGSGPFFVMERVSTSGGMYRGKPTSFAPDVALGQYGDIMVELLHDHSAEPSMLNDLYPAGSGRSGVHHLCYFVDDFASAFAEMEASFPTVFRTQMAGGTEVAISDTTSLNGHFMEYHECSEEIRGMYDFIKAAAEGFDGSDPVRDMPLQAMPVS